MLIGVFLFLTKEEKKTQPHTLWNKRKRRVADKFVIQYTQKLRQIVRLFWWTLAKVKLS